VVKATPKQCNEYSETTCIICSQIQWTWLFLSRFQSLKLPTNYGSSLAKHVLDKKLKSMKSHDYHMYDAIVVTFMLMWVHGSRHMDGNHPLFSKNHCMKIHEVHIHWLWIIVGFWIFLKKSIMLWQFKNYSKNLYIVIVIYITL
jgi:hypothetical protein